RMGPHVAEPGDGVGVEEQPEPLAGLDLLRQERVHDSNVVVARADQFEVPLLNEADVLAGREALCRRDRRDGDVDGVAPSVAVLDQPSELWSLVHTPHRSSNGFTTQKAERVLLPAGLRKLRHSKSLLAPSVKCIAG